MKKIVTLFTIVALSSFSLIAQNSSTKKADKHFARFEFIEAAEDYNKLPMCCKYDREMIISVNSNDIAQ